MVIADELKLLNEQLANAKDKSILSAQINYYHERLSAIKKTLFGKGEMKDVVFDGE